MSKAPDQNRKYRRPEGLEQADVDVMHLRVMIMDTKINKITPAYTCTYLFEKLCRRRNISLTP